MCGIAGILNLSGRPAQPAIVRAMTTAIAHRGPDGEGVYCDGPLGLGHRRLAIIDLTPAAEQPMHTPDGRFTIVYNGEIYNFRELRRELERLGHTFVSRGDGEVALHAFAEWGLEALPRFNGMFAFAIWDAERRELTLARDRYGIKPLYYAQIGSSFVFGSEAKALVQHPQFRAELDIESLLEYFTFQNFLGDRTLLKGVSILAAGTWLRQRAAESPWRTGRYWDFDFREPEHPADHSSYVEEL
ncbi:MAG: asparagine synthetase B, partial [Proteobacteria bacterium]|nr:asparagine synthetase B [Pseudomonadota bacterium]